MIRLIWPTHPKWDTHHTLSLVDMVDVVTPHHGYITTHTSLVIWATGQMKKRMN